MIYHITSLKGWREALQRGEYWADSLETEGFVHCSTGTQVVPVAEKYYKGERGLIVLVIDPARLTPDLRWEPPAEGAPPPGVPVGEMFPHIYGPINLEAIVRVVDLTSNPDGSYAVPILD